MGQINWSKLSESERQLARDVRADVDAEGSRRYIPRRVDSRRLTETERSFARAVEKDYRQQKQESEDRGRGKTYLELHPLTWK